MKLRILAIAAIVIGAVLIPTTASAKGTKDVTITGPGLEHPVLVGNTAGPDPVDVNRLADATGLFHVAFRTAPTPMTDARPAGKLGPRYRASYELYAAQDKVVVIRQDLYPFAAAGFVTHTPPRQHAFNQTVHSGWYVTTAASNTGLDSRSATALLIALGAPDPRATSSKVAHN